MCVYIYIYIYIYIHTYTPLYIDAFSNHPPKSIKQLPKMTKIISKKILDLSCTKEKFDKVKSVYESALKDSGHFSSMS